MNSKTILGLGAMAGLTLAAFGAMGAQAMASKPEHHALTATLVGSSEVPGPGSTAGTGYFTGDFKSKDTQLCYTLSVSDIAKPTAAHIHMGVAGKSGPPALPLEKPTLGNAKETCIAIAPALAAKIKADPAGYYVNVHNAKHPGGAIRGQLMGPM